MGPGLHRPPATGQQKCGETAEMQQQQRSNSYCSGDPGGGSLCGGNALASWQYRYRICILTKLTKLRPPSPWL